MNIGITVIAATLILLFLGVRVYVALAFPAIIYLVVMDIPFFVATQRMVRSLNSFTLLTIPLFLLVGSLMNNSEMTENLFELANNLVGHLVGGLAYVNVLTSLIFSGISGSAIADVGGIGRIMIESMEDHGYSRGYASALTVASATIGPIFPPSIILIIYGVLAEVSIIELLLAGILPGLLTFVLLLGGTAFIARRKEIPTHDRPSLATVFRSFLFNFAGLMTPVVLIGGMMGGFFGPTEASAVTVLYLLLINAVFYGKLDFTYIWESSKQTVHTTATVLIILAAASLFAWVLAIEGTAAIFANLLFSVSENTLVLLLLLNVMLLILGLFLEPVSALLISIPLVVPPFTSLGVDPVHLGIIMVFNLMIGLITPPLGLSLYVASDVGKIPIAEIVAELKPYYVVLIITLLIITFVPQISLLVPNGI